MNVSHNVQGILKTMKVINENLEASSHKSPRLPLDRNVTIELIDVNGINFEDDETWLYEASVRNSNVKDLNAWLHNDNRVNHLLHEIDAKKLIDSRTFTRPKKRFVRPSIENYNEGYFGMDKSENRLSIDTLCEETERFPLKFDLSQPINSDNFEKIVVNASDIDSFQNMSPPSLINSMCSSMFSNLMDSSMIKNDPLLREISVTDYPEAMLQDYDPPLFRSITDSCSSINLDNPESFIKQNSEGTLHSIYKKTVAGSEGSLLNGSYTAKNSTLNETYAKDSSSDISSSDICNDVSVTTINNTVGDLNGTYRKSPSSQINKTFEKISLCKSDDGLNSTVTYMNDSNRFTSPRRRSYIVEKKNETSTPQGIETKRNSVGHSAGSSDSLDYLSSLSTSSRDSNKMLNMAEVDAIVLQQEQSLHAMSTPNPTSKIISKLWEHSNISPVVSSERLNVYDSDPSDDYKTVKSQMSGSETSSSMELLNKTFEADPINNAYKTLNGMKHISNLRSLGSTLKGSYGNLKPLGVAVKGPSFTNNKGPTTNLKTMSTNLKSSYTQLKPVLLNLPCTDLKSYNTDSRVINRPNLANNLDANIKRAEVPPTVRDQIKSAPISSGSAKPQIRASGLPRPISSIPRPSNSKIPGAKGRPLTSRPLSRPISRHNLDYDF